MVSRYGIFSIFIVILALMCNQARAETPITLLGSSHGNTEIPLARIDTLVHSYIPLTAYRAVKIQVIQNAAHKPDHILAYLFSKTQDTFSITKIDITSNYQAKNIISNYSLTPTDLSQQPGLQTHYPHCPNHRLQLLVIAPNTISAQQSAALAVATTGKQAHLVTMTLLKSQATRKNILNAMHCPNLRGVFFTGDGNMNLIGTVDGMINSDDFKKFLTKKFHHHVITIFSSADGFQNPLQNTMTTLVQAQKYVASEDPLYIGYADKTAACTMIAIISNPKRDINDALAGCAKAYGSPNDQWNIAGSGSNYFGG